LPFDCCCRARRDRSDLHRATGGHGVLMWCPFSEQYASGEPAPAYAASLLGW
jgi:hypothetical protein